MLELIKPTAKVLLNSALMMLPESARLKYKEHHELRYWRGVSAAQKMTAVTELVETAYGMRGVDVHAERPKGPVVRVQRGGR